MVNNTSGDATITDQDGEFEMKVKLNDRIVFSSVQYQIRSVVINKDILQKSRLVMDVNEKVTVLDEVCLLYTSPSPRDRSLSRMPSSA